MGMFDQAIGALGGIGKGGGANAILLQQVVVMLSQPGALANLKSVSPGGQEPDDDQLSGLLSSVKQMLGLRR
jgi:hypothetical protein